VDRESALRVRSALTGFVRDEIGPDDQMLVLKPLDSLLTLRLTLDRDAVVDEIESFEGRLGDYEPRTPLEREMMAGAPARADDVRGQVAISALHALTTNLAQLPASRKALIVASGGFVPRAVRRGGTLLPTVDAVVRAANRSNVAIYPLNAAQITDPSDANAALLQRLARDTDGQVIDAAPGALRRVAAEMRDYYLIEVSPPADGRFHPVDVKAIRPGLSVKTRPGVWTVSSEDLARARLAVAPLPPPPPVLPALRTSRLIRPWIGQSRASVAGRTQLTVVWEATIQSAQSAGGPERRLPPSRLRVKALGADGTAVFEGVVAASTRGPAANATRAVFDVPPGRLRLQMSVEDAAGREIDADVRDVIVLPLGGPIALGTPAVYRARTTRAFNELLDDAGAPPAAGREFSRDERLLIRLPLYADETTVLRAALTGRRGQTLRDLPVALAAEAPERTIDLPLAGLAAGEYAVVITARHDSREAQETVQFRVTP
jgi:VWFA-related protein